MLNKEKKFNESVIYKFNDCDTVYIPKGYTLQKAIDWYTKEYDEIDEKEMSEVDYTDGFWDSNIPKDVADRIYKDNPSDYDTYNLDKKGELKEGTIQYRYGDLFIYKTFKTAKEENDKLDADIFVICSREW